MTASLPIGTQIPVAKWRVSWKSRRGLLLAEHRRRMRPAVRALEDVSLGHPPKRIQIEGRGMI
jgi:hypothetical protein